MIFLRLNNLTVCFHEQDWKRVLHPSEKLFIFYSYFPDFLSAQRSCCFQWHSTGSTIVRFYAQTVNGFIHTWTLGLRFSFVPSVLFLMHHTQNKTILSTMFVWSFTLFLCPLSWNWLGPVHIVMQIKNWSNQKWWENSNWCRTWQI